jgi:hypothetical protein
MLRVCALKRFLILSRGKLEIARFSRSANQLQAIPPPFFKECRDGVKDRGERNRSRQNYSTKARRKADLGGKGLYSNNCRENGGDISGQLHKPRGRNT